MSYVTRCWIKISFKPTQTMFNEAGKYSVKVYSEINFHLTLIFVNQHDFFFFSDFESLQTNPALNPTCIY